MLLESAIFIFCLSTLHLEVDGTGTIGFTHQWELGFTEVPKFQQRRTAVERRTQILSLHPVPYCDFVTQFSTFERLWFYHLQGSALQRRV